jgi:2-polyprenyl-6-methoxyphenol hydroxylase-like FAD-dependent oxidoreductase
VTPALDVLIAGAGPVGLTLAYALARQGVACRVVDRARHRPTGTRCPVLWPATLTDLAVTGLAVSELAAGSVPLARKVFHLDGDAFGHGLAEPACPWPTPISAGQDRVERLLRRELRGLGVPVGHGVRVCAVDQRDEGVAVMLDGPDGRHQMAARYLVLALGDTAEAATLAGVARPERPFAGYRTLQADARVANGHLPRDEEHIFLSGQRHVGFVPLPGGRHRVFVTLPADQVPDAADVVAQVSGVPVDWLEPPWTVEPRSGLAGTFHTGRCFLVGESAKSTPQPVHGLNSGIQDAVNLAWKLGAVLNGTAAPELLATYDSERRPVAEALVERTERIFAYGTSTNVDGELRERVRQRRHDVRNQPDVGYAGGPLALDALPDAPAVGGRLADASVEMDGRVTTLFGVLPTLRWTLLVRDRAAAGTALQALTRDRPWLAVRRVRPRPGGVDMPELCLVRPDGYVAAAAGSGQVARLDGFLTDIGYPGRTAVTAEGGAACR